MFRSAGRSWRSSALYHIGKMENPVLSNLRRAPCSSRSTSLCACNTRTSILHLLERCRLPHDLSSVPKYSVFSGAPKDTRTKPTELSDNEYHEKADRTLGSLSAFFEDIGDNFRENPDYDVMYASGVLTVSLLPGYTIVMNKQSPNHQIWLSSPISGPKRYDFENETWTYHHDGSTLHDLLSKEVSELLKRPVDFTGCDFGQSKSS
ncbi:hypothetical protein RvY_09668-1 [Ramazzottius varieornatus]|uniref:ferroxidase n=1 Tax=Ramazzottius varieornatus TaxID=947166 RepID=A0A1D1VCJ4_RAMVA|nr:hypothetical protein RvY_09668-1 [Ramazzottius varieornatus]